MDAIMIYLGLSILATLVWCWFMRGARDEPMPTLKLCVACRTHHPVDHFDKAAPDFPTRDGLNYNCRASKAGNPYRLMRMPNGKVEAKPLNEEVQP
jgi:hypothetical protein